MEIIIKDENGTLFGSTKIIGIGKRQPNLIYGEKAKELREKAGLTIDEASAKYPGFSEDNYLGTIDDVNFVSPIHATTKATKVADYTKALSEIVNDAKDGDNILVAGHSTFVWLLQKYFPESFNSESSLKNASVTVLKYHDGKWELK